MSPTFGFHSLGSSWIRSNTRQRSATRRQSAECSEKHWSPLGRGKSAIATERLEARHDRQGRRLAHRGRRRSSKGGGENGMRRIKPKDQSNACSWTARCMRRGGWIGARKPRPCARAHRHPCRRRLRPRRPRPRRGTRPSAPFRTRRRRLWIQTRSTCVESHRPAPRPIIRPFWHAPQSTAHGVEWLLQRWKSCITPSKRSEPGKIMRLTPLFGCSVVGPKTPLMIPSWRCC